MRSLLRRRGSIVHSYVVCVCSCHAGCPLTGRSSVAPAIWAQQCTCPGAAPIRARQDREYERRRELHQVVTGARREGRLPPEELERRLGAVYLGHGESPPPGLTGWARMLSAGTARPGTRTPRLLWLGVRAVAGTIRWAWQPDRGATADGRAGARTLYRTLGVMALVSALLTAAAASASRGRRLGPGVGAALSWFATLWGTVLGTAVTQIVRSAAAHPDRDHGSDDERPGP